MRPGRRHIILAVLACVVMICFVVALPDYAIALPIAMLLLALILGRRRA